MLTASMIAAYYGLELPQHRAEIVDSLKQSRECAGSNGKSRAQYFDGYLTDIAAEINADSRAARTFNRNAYYGV